MENSIEVLQKIKKIEVLYDSATLPLDTHPKKVKSICQRDISTPMFTAVLFTMAKKWKQPMSTN
jgi:hypothetical protein